MNTQAAVQAHSDASKQQPAQLRGTYQYPGLGDPLPFGGETVLLLTQGGACVSGVWKEGAGFIGWCSKPMRDRAKEDGLTKP